MASEQGQMENQVREQQQNEMREQLEKRIREQQEKERRKQQKENEVREQHENEAREQREREIRQQRKEEELRQEQKENATRERQENELREPYRENGTRDQQEEEMEEPETRRNSFPRRSSSYERERDYYHKLRIPMVFKLLGIPGINVMLAGFIMMIVWFTEHRDSELFRIATVFLSVGGTATCIGILLGIISCIRRSRKEWSYPEQPEPTYMKPAVRSTTF